MPSSEKSVGTIKGIGDEEFNVVVETDSDDRIPKYVFVRNIKTGVFETSFAFANPPTNCPLSRAAAIVAGSLGHIGSVSFKTVYGNMDEVIDWEDTANLQNGRQGRHPIDWS